MKKKIYKQCHEHLGNEKDSFRVVLTEVCEYMMLTDNYKSVRNEIVSFIDSKAENYEEIKKGDIEKLSHFNDLSCRLETALRYDVLINETFRCYIWALIQSGDINASDWDSFDDIVESEIGYLTSE